MNTLRSSLYRFLSICLAGGMLCALLGGCGTKSEPSTGSSASKSTSSSQSTSSTSDAPTSQTDTQPEPENTTAPELDYTPYDGYTYQENGKMKYALKLDHGFQMRCMFQSGDPEPYEEIYTMDLSTADQSEKTLTVHTIRDGRGNNISDKFRALSYTFLSDKVIMIVERDESTLAGGSSDNVLTGTYTFTAAQQETADNAEKTYTPAELCEMAQNYYKRHNDFFPPEADSTQNGDGTVTIHLYENVNNGDGTFHTATSAWYTVNNKGVGTNDITGESVQLTE